MNRENKIRFMLGVLVLSGLGCGLSPASIAERAVDAAIEGAQATLEAGTGIELGDVQATTEALLEGVDVEGLQATVEAVVGDGLATGEDVVTDFPIPEGALNVVQIAETLNITTLLSLEDVVAFYRDEFNTQGLIERADQTVVEQNSAYLVFDGHDSGKAVVLTIVSLDLIGVNITIILEDS